MRWAGFSLLIFFSFFYALPNFFRPEAALLWQREGRITTQEAQHFYQLLLSKQIPLRTLTLEKEGVMISFPTPQDRADAKHCLMPVFGHAWRCMPCSRPTLPRWLQQLGGRTLPLGLDLQGGTHLLFALSADSGAAQGLNAIQGMAQRWWAQQGVLSTRTTEGISLDAAAWNRLHPIFLAQFPAWRVKPQGEEIHLLLPEARLAQLNTEVLFKTMSLLRQRIQAMGVFEPIVQQQGQEHIAVLLPDTEDPAVALQQLTHVAQLLGSREQEQRPLTVRDAYAVQGAHGAFQVKVHLHALQPFPLTLHLTRPHHPPQWVAKLEHFPEQGLLLPLTLPESEAKTLAFLLRLPNHRLPITLIATEHVGPSVGARCVLCGGIAAIIGALLLIAALILRYRRLGLWASATLLLNLLLMTALLSLQAHPLTLLGLTALMLVTGMMVEVSVVLLTEGGLTRSAVGRILDGMLPVGVATLTLYVAGQGAMHSFTRIVLLGECVGAFGAFYVLPPLLRLGGRPAPACPKIALPRGRGLIWISIAFVGLSLVSLGRFGLYWSIELSGGSAVEVTAPHVQDTAHIRQPLVEAGIAHPVVQQLSRPHGYLIRYAGKAQVERLFKALSALEPQLQVNRITSIGPHFGSALSLIAVRALIFAALAALCTIAWRFNIRAAFYAGGALLHTLVLLLGMLAWLQLEFNLSVMMALLTLLGLSMRHSGFFFNYLRRSDPETALQQTLNLHSLTSMVAVLILLPLLATPWWRSFSATLLLGMGLEIVATAGMALLLRQKPGAQCQ